VEYVFDTVRLILVSSPVIAAVLAGGWLSRSWRECGAGEVAARALMIAVGGVVMCYAVGLGFAGLIFWYSDACMEAASTTRARNDCDPGLGAVLGAVMFGLPWLLLTLLGAVAFVASLGKMIWTRT
jgi:hypothetical protein